VSESKKIFKGGEVKMADEKIVVKIEGDYILCNHLCDECSRKWHNCNTFIPFSNSSEIIRVHKGDVVTIEIKRAENK